MNVDDTKPFPIQAEYRRNPKTGYMEHLPGSSIPWWLAEEAYAYYSKCFGTSQSLETLAARGGFGRTELLMLLRKEPV